MKSGVYVRAQTSDNRWATIDAVHLSDESFKVFILRQLAEAGMVASFLDEGTKQSLQTRLTKAEAEYYENLP